MASNLNPYYFLQQSFVPTNLIKPSNGIVQGVQGPSLFPYPMLQFPNMLLPSNYYLSQTAKTLFQSQSSHLNGGQTLGDFENSVKQLQSALKQTGLTTTANDKAGLTNSKRLNEEDSKQKAQDTPPSEESIKFESKGKELKLDEDMEKKVKAVEEVAKKPIERRKYRSNVELIDSSQQLKKSIRKLEVQYPIVTREDFCCEIALYL